MGQQILRGPDDLDQQVLSWILDYRSRESEQFDDLLYSSPKFTLGKLAAVVLKRMKNSSFLGLGQQSSVEKSFSLRTFVSYLTENLTKRDTTFVKGLKLSEIQQLSE